MKNHIPKVRSPPIAVPCLCQKVVREEDPAPEHTIEARPPSPHHLSADIGCLLSVLITVVLSFENRPKKSLIALFCNLAWPYMMHV